LDIEFGYLTRLECCSNVNDDTADPPIPINVFPTTENEFIEDPLHMLEASVFSLWYTDDDDIWYAEIEPIMLPAPPNPLPPAACELELMLAATFLILGLHICIFPRFKVVSNWQNHNIENSATQVLPCFELP
jgi:hypothetical protein